MQEYEVSEPCSQRPMVARYNAQFSVWDDTLSDTFTPSYLDLTTMEAGAVAEESEHKKAKYVELTQNTIFPQSQSESPEYLALRLVTSSMSFATCTSSKRSRMSLSSTNISFREFQWQISGEKLLLCLGYHLLVPEISLFGVTFHFAYRYTCVPSLL